jgi:hypothetical protein
LLFTPATPQRARRTAPRLEVEARRQRQRAAGQQVHVGPQAAEYAGKLDAAAAGARGEGRRRAGAAQGRWPMGGKGQTTLGAWRGMEEGMDRLRGSPATHTRTHTPVPTPIPPTYNHTDARTHTHTHALANIRGAHPMYPPPTMATFPGHAGSSRT